MSEGDVALACVNALIDELARGGRLKPGDHVAFCAFGGGATWGASLVRWTMARQCTGDGAGATASGLAGTRTTT